MCGKNSKIEFSIWPSTHLTSCGLNIKRFVVVVSLSHQIHSKQFYNYIIKMESGDVLGDQEPCLPGAGPLMRYSLPFTEWG